MNREPMRVVIVTESFPPDVNGVAHSVVRVAEHLIDRGHDPLVIAPQPAATKARVAGPLPYPVVRVPSTGLPGYPGFRLGLPGGRIADIMCRHQPDVVHLAALAAGRRHRTVRSHQARRPHTAGPRARG
jgi:phosphatidylinositol alpha 1,6-mannosyltransferase